MPRQTKLTSRPPLENDLEMLNPRMFLRASYKHKPSGVPASSESESGMEYTISASITLSAFRESGNPLYALLLIREANRKGVAPHEFVLQWLGSCCEQWLEAEGTISMDQIMGLATRKGQDPVFKTALLTHRNEMLFMDIARLRALHVPLPDAAYMVARRLEDTPDWNTSRWKLPKLEASSLEQMYKRWTPRREVEQGVAKTVAEWDPQKVGDFVRRFPGDAIPSRLKPFVGRKPKS